MLRLQLVAAGGESKVGKVGARIRAGVLGATISAAAIDVTAIDMAASEPSTRTGVGVISTFFMTLLREVRTSLRGFKLLRQLCVPLERASGSASEGPPVPVEH